MRRIAGVTVVVALLWLVAAPIAAAKDPMPDPQVPLTGTYVDTSAGGITDIEAGEPFYLQNGWCGFPDERVILLRPDTMVQFTMNGTRLQARTIVDMHFDLVADCPFAKYSYVNFRHGLPAGTYVFDVEWVWAGETLGASTGTLHVH